MYNSKTRKLIWTISRLPKSAQNTEADFNVSIKPTINDIGKVLILVPQVDLVAVDMTTGVNVSKSIKAITTSFNDPIMGNLNGIVQYRKWNFSLDRVKSCVKVNSTVQRVWGVTRSETVQPKKWARSARATPASGTPPPQPTQTASTARRRNDRAFMTWGGGNAERGRLPGPARFDAHASPPLRPPTRAAASRRSASAPWPPLAPRRPRSTDSAGSGGSSHRGSARRARTARAARPS